jgi:HJR/Mrr/RecB family endonuclease
MIADFTVSDIGKLLAHAASLRVRRIDAATRSLELQAILVASRNKFILLAARSVPRAAHSFRKLADSDLQKAGSEFLNGRLQHFIEHAIVIYTTTDTENAYFGAVLLTTRLIGPDDFARRSLPLAALSSVVNDRSVKVIKVG